jgi:plastocyanin
MTVFVKLAGSPWGVVPTVACALAFIATGCGSESDDPEKAAVETSSSRPAADSGATGSVEILDFKYEPDPVEVEAGTTVTWTNQDSADHTATADDDSFDTGVFGKGDEGEVTLDSPGTYPYHCDLHPFMEGEVVVE